MQIQVQNTTQRAIRLPGRGVKEDDGRFKLIKQGLGQLLVPGSNAVPGEVWKDAKGNPAIKQWVAAGYLREGSGKLPEEDLPAGEILERAPPSTLLGMQRDEAKLRIAECDDRELLTRWAAADNRDAIIKVIEKRLAELS